MASEDILINFYHIIIEYIAVSTPLLVFYIGSYLVYSYILIS